jgi:hypothetical protein
LASSCQSQPAPIATFHARLVGAGRSANAEIVPGAIVESAMDGEGESMNDVVSERQFAAVHPRNPDLVLPRRTNSDRS